MPWHADPRIVTVLLGLSAAVALAAPGPARASAPGTPRLDGPTCPTSDRTAGPTRTPTGGDAARKPLHLVPPEPGQPVVAATPSHWTGSRMTLTGLRVEGVVQLPTVDGTVTTLKFKLDRAVTDDLRLDVPAPAGRTPHLRTGELTLSGNVALYATRLVGKLLDDTITLAPDLPLPDGVPLASAAPITLTEPAIDMVFVDSDTLTARSTLKLTPS
ncbi:hypothetical protein ACFOW4_18825 [Micromonospora sp. GCM10011542]|uniref:hypothetical protein n=1 Tax=Micromonospora sp. GCM10011542 TaxID=3317337 RepID=UPI0036176178